MHAIVKHDYGMRWSIWCDDGQFWMDMYSRVITYCILPISPIFYIGNMLCVDKIMTRSGGKEVGDVLGSPFVYKCQGSDLGGLI